MATGIHARAVLPWLVLGALVLLSVEAMECVGQSFGREASGEPASHVLEASSGRQPATAPPREIVIQLTVHDTSTGTFTQLPCMTTTDHAVSAPPVVESDDYLRITRSLCHSQEELLEEYGPAVVAGDASEPCAPPVDPADINFYMLSESGDVPPPHCHPGANR
jgi:hypothetical protein